MRTASKNKLASVKYLAMGLVIAALLSTLVMSACDSSDKKISVALPSIRSASAVGLDRLWLINEHNQLVLLDSAGKQLTPKDSPTESLAEIFFLDPDTGWAISTLGQVLSTQNGGGDWVDLGRVSNGAAIGLSRQLIFSNAKTGWLVDSFGMSSTDDGGHTWVRIFPNQGTIREDLPKEPLQYIPLGADIGWVLTAKGTVLRTVDKGKQWERSRLPLDARIVALFFQDKNIGWAVSESEGKLYRTINGGESWEASSVPQIQKNYSITSVYFSDSENGWLTGKHFSSLSGGNSLNDSGVLLRTRDGGKTWEQVFAVPGDRLEKILAVDNQPAWIIGNNSVYSSRDGESWASTIGN